MFRTHLDPSITLTKKKKKRIIMGELCPLPWFHHLGFSLPPTQIILKPSRVTLTNTQKMAPHFRPNNFYIQSQNAVPNDFLVYTQQTTKTPALKETIPPKRAKRKTTQSFYKITITYIPFEKLVCFPLFLISSVFFNTT